MTNNGRAEWSEVLAHVEPLVSPEKVANSDAIRSGPFWDLYRPLLVEGPFVVAHLAQSLDGFVALTNGESQWISGFEDQVHTHRLRAIVHAVIVGVQTVIDDDPQLTVRHCEGPSPVRIVIDPSGRAPRDRKVFTDGGQTIRFTQKAESDFDVELTGSDGVFAPGAILSALRERGLNRVLVEGGGVTVSRFLDAGVVDRLHLTVAPMLIGGGRPAFPVPLCEHLAEVTRFTARPVALGSDWLFDCALRGV